MQHGIVGWASRTANSGEPGRARVFSTVVMASVLLAGHGPWHCFESPGTEAGYFMKPILV